MDIVLQSEFWLFRGLAFLALGIELWALADCAKRKATSFEATLKRTKGFWLGMTGGSAAVGAFTAWFGAFGLFGILQLVAVIAACVYLADVKPAVSEVQSGGYGSW
ncbi:hypothetical protein BJ994_000330 [Arthrobacter pigmenti]|uniref:DUF2516 family protein n=1 Tax=Arthrobacter pigmenti TaxID=271432 RepID=A0A846RLT3_9MICC|nr:hypothetical protein [Arthrobacter pigmenti]